MKTRIIQFFHETSIHSQFFVSEISLSHFTTQFLSSLITKSLDLLKLNEKEGVSRLNDSTLFSIPVVLRNILKILEVDRLLQYTFNALVIDDLIFLLPKGKLENHPDIDFIKESLTFVTMMFFKRAYLIMNVLKTLTQVKDSNQMTEEEN